MSAETDWSAVADAAHSEWVDSQQRERIDPSTPIGPRECPVTGRVFYDNMEHPDLGWIAMYGGPLDVYSIPRLDATGDELRVERYDLDADGWVEGGEPLGYFYREQQPDHEAEVARLRAEPQNAAKAALDAVALSCEKEREADALRAELEWLRSWLPPMEVLVSAVEEEFCSELTEASEPDHSKVSYPEEDCPITFGMIREARKAVDYAMGASA